MSILIDFHRKEIILLIAIIFFAFNYFCAEIIANSFLRSFFGIRYYLVYGEKVSRFRVFWLFSQEKLIPRKKKKLLCGFAKVYPTRNFIGSRFAKAKLMKRTCFFLFSGFFLSTICRMYSISV